MMLDSLSPGSLVALDYVGIGVFAVSGALLAAKKRQNLVTFVFFAVATGVGGGTLRDLLIGAPVFWVQHNASLLVCCGAAAGVWFLSSATRTERAILWFDAIGLAAYSVYGTDKALQFDIAPVPACFMGIMTASAGGIVRDLLAQEPSIILRPEIYVTAAAMAAGLYALFFRLGVPPLVAAAVAGSLGFAMRAFAISRGLSLPSYRR